MSKNKPHVNIPEVKIECKFHIAWVGKCKNDADISGYCSEHKNIKCSKCDKQATHDCDMTMGLVCGQPLYNQCKCNH